MSASGGGWRGGKKSSPAKSQSSSSSTAPSSRGWKSSKKSSGNSRKRNPKKLSQFLTVAFCLFILVGIAIWIFWPNYQLHTHFVVLDPLQGNDRFPYSAQVHFPASEGDEVSHFDVGKHSRMNASSLDFFDDDEFKSEKSDLKQADVCVIYLRAAIIPGNDQSHLMLLKNSTPDPQIENQHELLTSLKTKISQLSDRQKIVLIVDVNSMDQDWRTGMFGDSPHAELIKWSEEIPNLITILSCDVGERSWTAGLPGFGGSVFEMVLSNAFSLDADQPREGSQKGDGELTLRELYEYLANETNFWVTANRNRAGQHVQIHPPIEEVELGKNGRPLIIMKGLAEPVVLQPENNAAKDLVDQLPDLWKHLQQDKEVKFPFSVPVLFAAAQSQLRSAEKFLMHGRLEVAETYLENSKENFLRAREISDDATDKIEISFLRKDNLAEHSEINSWLASTRLAAKDNENSPSDSADAVLQNNLNSFPFSELTVPKPRQVAIDEIKNARRRMEKSTALMFHDAYQFQPLLKQMQLELLEVEDLLFVNSRHLPSDYSVPDQQKFLNSFDKRANLIEEYVLLKLEVEGLQLRLFGLLPELAEWGAGFYDTGYLTQVLKALETREPPIVSRANDAEKLQITVVELLNSTEDLLSLYLKQSTQQFQTSEELETSLVELKTNYHSLNKTWEQIQDLLPRVSSSIPRAVASRWSQSFNSTKLPIYTEQIRSEFIEGGMLPWSSGEPETVDSKKLKAAPSSNVQLQNYREHVVWNTAWRLRLQDVIASTNNALSEEVDDQTQAMWEHWHILKKASSTEEIHDELFELGASIRSDWESRRNQLVTSLKYSGNDLHEYSLRLLKADMAARFFRFDDLDLWRTQREIQLAFERTNQVEYCLLLADHALMSQWTNPTEKLVQNANKWFYQQADSWLKLAEQLITKDASLGIAQQSVESRRQKLSNADKWTELVQSQMPALQRFEDEQQITFNAKFDLEGSRPDGAISSLTFLGTKAESGSRKILELTRNGIPIRLSESKASLEVKINRLTIPDSDDCSSISLKPQIFYRGRSIQQNPIVINPCPSSQRTWQYLAGRQSAQINVKGNDNRPIVFVLDWSASMNEKDANGDPKQRHLAAANAVEQIIEKMPPTMRVGLVVFGHSSRDAQEEPNITFKDNFKDYVEVGKRSPFQDVDIIHDIGLLESDKEIIKHKLNLLKNVTPYASTPLGLAMTSAAQLLSRNSDSGGIVVAITDGAPTDLGNAANVFPDNAAAAKRRQNIYDKTFNELERAFRPDDISAILFALDFGAEDLTMLQCLFGSGNNQGPCSFMGRKESLQFPIVRASGEGDRDGGTLRDRIDAEIEPRLFQVFYANGDPVAEEPLKDASIPVKADETYRIRFGDIDIENIQLSKGDEITLEMNWSKGRFDIKRDFVSHRLARIKQTVGSKTDIPDTLTINKVKRPNINSDPDFFEHIELDVMLDHSRSFRPVRKPEEIWFEIHAKGDAKFHPDAVIEEYTSEFGAPGWNLKISPWPKNRNIQLDAFWKMSRTRPDEIFTIEQLKTATSRSEALNIGGKGQPIPASKMWHKVRNDNGRRIYEIRIEPEDKINFNILTDLTIEIGETGLLTDNSTFTADATTHLKTTVNSGVIVHAFEYPEQNINLDVKAIALTTRQSREKDALHLSNLIETGID